MMLFVQNVVFGSILSRMQFSRSFLRSALLLLATLLLASQPRATAVADGPTKTVETEPSAEKLSAADSPAANQLRPEQIDAKGKARRDTAVALNYCRAAFHRIRRTSNRAVLYQEQQRILNNLDLNGIADEAVIKLYSTMLNEINQFEIAKRERVLIEGIHRNDLQRQFGTDLFVIGAQVATGQVGNAVRSGVNSWWDFRSKETRRTQDVWKIERDHMQSLVNRSSEFLNAFWKLSRANSIPDNWLVRETDLDRLDLAIREHDPEVRLRVLSRMARFMEMYPPYYYYMARTQQQLGDFAGAAATYERLSRLGDGFFRNDDMMSASLANLAMIKQQLNQPDAVQTAMAALDQSNRVWEANVASAWVLSQNGEYDQAEDALLRNLDVDLEQTYSTRSLVSLYYHSHNKQKLANMIAQPKVARLIPVTGLLKCAATLGSERLPDSAKTQLSQSVYGMNARYGQNSFSVVAAPGWNLAKAQITLEIDGRQVRASSVKSNGKQTEVRFSPIARRTQSRTSATAHTRSSVELALKWRNTPEVRLLLNSPQASSRKQQVFRNPSIINPLGLRLQPGTDPRFRLSSVEIGNVQLSMQRSDSRRS